jgi:hypothetical protein
LRATELTGLTHADIHLGTGAHVACHGKGRKDRITPLTTATVTVLRDWITENPRQDTGPLFPTNRGVRMSSDALQQRLALHAGPAAERCTSLHSKTITPHVLCRHTCAKNLLHAGVDITVIALWLGRHHTNLPASRPRPQTASPGPYHPAHHAAWPLPTTRPTPGLPRRPVIMPNQLARAPPAASADDPGIGITMGSA